MSKTHTKTLGGYRITGTRLLVRRITTQYGHSNMGGGFVWEVVTPDRRVLSQHFTLADAVEAHTPEATT